VDIQRSIIVAAALLLASEGTAWAQPGERPIGILLAAGDISSCAKDDKEHAWHRYANQTAGLIRDAIKKAKEANPPIPVRVLALGDLAYGDGTAKQFECFGARWSGFEKEMLPVPGNHDYHTDGGAPYYQYFKDHPAVTQNGPRLGYFAVNFPDANGPWRLVGLNSEFGDDKTKSKSEKKKAIDDQLKWLAKAIDVSNPATNQNCVLAFWHRPTFTSGRHGHKGYTSPKPDAELAKHRPMQAAFRVLHQHGATAVLAGHEHNYEQFTPQDADGKAAEDGVRLFVVGTGGAILTHDFYTKLEANSEGVFGKDKGVQGVLKIELFAKRYSWEFLSIDPKKSIPLKTTNAGCIARKTPPA
jgi:3',5'-cyclic AMP phosphodiesterase CpdA